MTDEQDWWGNDMGKIEDDARAMHKEMVEIASGIRRCAKHDIWWHASKHAACPLCAVAEDAEVGRLVREALVGPNDLISYVVGEGYSVTLSCYTGIGGGYISCGGMPNKDKLKEALREAIADRKRTKAAMEDRDE